MWPCSRWRSTLGATRHSGSGSTARYSSTGTGRHPPVNSIDSMATTLAVIPVAWSPVTCLAVPVSRSAEKGAPAGTETRTALGPEPSHRATGDPVEGSSSGCRRALTGREPGLPEAG